MLYRFISEEFVPRMIYSIKRNFISFPFYNLYSSIKFFKVINKTCVIYNILIKIIIYLIYNIVLFLKFFLKIHKLEKI